MSALVKDSNNQSGSTKVHVKVVKKSDGKTIGEATYNLTIE